LEALGIGPSHDGILVELGSGTGEFVEAAHERGFDALGIEPSAAAVAVAAHSGVRLFQGSFGEWRAASQGEKIDLVVMWHVLEHVPSPLELLHEVRDAMDRGGRIAIEVPNWGSTEAQELREAWHHAQISDHVVHFTVEGLGTLLTRAGFVPLSVEPLSEECYSSVRTWTRRKNHALKHRKPWPPHDLLRATAVVGG
jgi:2-polyprenyl-3-methyl-5-hydroxy-6-metoxy-1,4-benzoquinol methylase